MKSFEPGGCAVVIGASGGIGQALVRRLSKDDTFATVLALARTFEPDLAAKGKIRYGPIDITDEASIVEAASGVEDGPALRLVVVATGALHGEGGLAPEKTYRALDPASLLQSYRVNAIGPALVAKHWLPHLAPRSVFAALSARVSSISDNRAGGWHAYRASKAALNMLVKTLAIETARRNPQTLCVGLQPGTVDTALSRPYQRGVPSGQLFTPDQSAAHLLDVIDGLTASDNGDLIAWDGATIAP